MMDSIGEDQNLQRKKCVSFITVA